jgi:hypothetical protein
MPTPNEVYNSGQVPHGGFFAKIYRGQTAPALLGTYLVESAAPSPNAVETDRPHTDGGDNGFVLVDGKKEGAATIQRAAAATPSLKNGDFFKTSVIEVDSAGAAVTEIYVIKGPSQDTDASYRKQSCTIRQDKQPTATVLAIDEYAA